MHAILINVGTGGDIFPYIGLGARLRTRGHRVTLAVNENYRAAAEEHDLDFEPLVTTQETEDFLGHPDVWHPVKSAGVAARWGVRFFDRQYALLARLARDPEAVLVASPAVFAARLVQEKLGRPLASVILQPWLLPSVYAPPILPGFTLPRWAPRSAGLLYWRLVDAVGDLLIGRPLNRLRGSIGLRPGRRVFKWWLSPQLVLGLFPDWYGVPQPDWPAQLRLTGFPMYDGQPLGGLPAEVLDFCHAGPPPVAFTFGTGMMHGTGLFRAAVEACQRLKVPGLFLTKYPAQLPDPLPPTIRHFAFAPFRELFPHCAAIVHHGGIGTTARGLAAGIPQLILPHAYDQMDNATRVQRLGAGAWLKPKHSTGPRLAEVLGDLLSPAARARCRPAAADSHPDEGLDTAVDWLEYLAQSVRDGFGFRSQSFV